jgi:DALR anticodon binding protein
LSVEHPDLIGAGSALKSPHSTVGSRAPASPVATAVTIALSGDLFEVASLFTTCYEQCPVIQADDEETRNSRLALCAAVLRVLTAGLGLLGVPIPDRM